MPRTYTGPAAAAPAAGAVPSADPGLAALRHAVGAVRAAHLLVAVTGSSGANAFFMEPNKASGFIEVWAWAFMFMCVCMSVLEWQEKGWYVVMECKACMWGAGLGQGAGS